MYRTDLTEEEVRATLKEVRAHYGDWAAHNVELPYGIYTRGPKYTGEDRASYLLHVAETALGSSLEGRSVLDLGALEGGISIRFGQSGASVVHGVEVRQQNVAKAKCASKLLGLNNVTFLQEDVLQLDHCTILLRQYDVIICAGLLYHFDVSQIRPVLSALHRRCNGICCSTPIMRRIQEIRI